MAKNLSVALRILANSDQANAELQKVQASLDRMRGALARVGHYGALAFSGWNIVGGIGELAKLADSVKLMDARLRLAAQSTSEFLTAQKLAVNVARQTGTSYESVATLYARLSQTGKDYGLTAQRIGTITTATAQALKLSFLSRLCGGGRTP